MEIVQIMHKNFSQSYQAFLVTNEHEGMNFTVYENFYDMLGYGKAVCDFL